MVYLSAIGTPLRTHRSPQGLCNWPLHNSHTLWLGVRGMSKSVPLSQPQSMLGPQAQKTTERGKKLDPGWARRWRLTWARAALSLVEDPGTGTLGVRVTGSVLGTQGQAQAQLERQQSLTAAWLYLGSKPAAGGSGQGLAPEATKGLIRETEAANHSQE